MRVAPKFDFSSSPVGDPAASAPVATPAFPSPFPSSTALTIAATTAAAAALLVDLRPRLLALLGHCVEGLIEPLGLDPALANAQSIRVTLCYPFMLAPGTR